MNLLHLYSWARCALLGALALGTAAALAQQAGDGWLRTGARLRLGAESVALPEGERMGLVGASYLLDLQPGLCAGPAVYGAATGERGGLFVVGAEAAWCPRGTGPLRLQAGLFVGGGGGGAAPVGGGLMLRPHVDLLVDFGHWSAGVSLSRVSFPSGEIASTQLGLVVEWPGSFVHLAPGAAPLASPARTGLGFERVLAVAGVYLPPSGSMGNGGAPLAGRIATVGLRAERAIAGAWYGGVEVNGAASGAAGYAELLAQTGVRLPLDGGRVALGARVALGMGGGGAVPVGGGLLAKAAAEAQLRLTPEFGLAVEGGWARAPQGSFSAPFASVALRWDLEVPAGAAPRTAWQTFGGGVETYRAAARKSGAPRSLSNVVFRMDRSVGEGAYLTGQVRSAFAGDAGAFAVGLFGLGLQAQLDGAWRLGAELLAGAAGGGGVDVGSGAVVQPMAFVAVQLTPAVALRLGAGRVKAVNGPLSSTAADLTLSYAYGVGR